jgi:hypothetical protein
MKSLASKKLLVVVLYALIGALFGLMTVFHPCSPETLENLKHIMTTVGGIVGVLLVGQSYIDQKKA